MKIDQSVNKPSGVTPIKAATERQGAAGTSAGAASGTTGDGADVNLSPLAAQVRDVQAQLAQSGSADVNVARVAELQQAIREGRLTINPDKIAKGLLASAREMLTAQKPS